MAAYAKLKMVDKLPFATAVTKKISETWIGNEELSTVYPQETKIPGNENGQYKISCFGITNNDLTFGFAYFYLCRGLYSDTPCNGDAPGNKLFRFEDHCVNLFTLSGTVPVILESNGEKIILPAFIAGQIMQTAKADKIDELRSFYAGLLLPELIVKPSTLSGWSKFLKGDGIVVENVVGKKVLGAIVKNGNKIEYINPAGKLVKWEEQLEQGIISSIASKKANANDLGGVAEAKAAELVQSRKKIEGFNQLFKNSKNQTVAELDIITADEIIEVKRNISLAKNKFTLDEQAAYVAKPNNENFINPYNRRKILYVEEPLPRNSTGELFQSDKQYISELKDNGIDFANSLRELLNLLK